MLSEFTGKSLELKNLLRIWQALDTVFRNITNLGRDINGPGRLPNIMKISVVESPVAYVARRFTTCLRSPGCAGSGAT